MHRARRGERMTSHTFLNFIIGSKYCMESTILHAFNDLEKVWTCEKLKLTQESGYIYIYKFLTSWWRHSSSLARSMHLLIWIYTVVILKTDKYTNAWYNSGAAFSCISEWFVPKLSRTAELLNLEICLSHLTFWIKRSCGSTVTDCSKYQYRMPSASISDANFTYFYKGYVHFEKRY